MLLYLSIILGTIVVVSILDIIFAMSTFMFTAGEIVKVLVLSVVFEFAIDGLFAFIVNKLPNTWFDSKNKFYKVSKAERKFYDKLGIKRWKDKVWELGSLGGFRKNKIYDQNNPEYFERFIIESNKGVLTHRIGYLVGFLCYFLYPKYFWIAGFPVAIVNLFLNILPTMVLRYNIPRLEAAKIRAQRNEMRLNEFSTNKEPSQLDEDVAYQQ